MILGISFDAPEANRLFREKFDFPFDLLSDTDKRVSLAYGAAEGAEAPRPTRISYLIGPDGRIAKVYAKVVPAEHPDQVLADLG